MFQPLMDLLKAIPGVAEGYPKFLVAFDEASNLYFNEDTDIRHIALRRVWRAMIRLPVWMVFMSTDSTIEVFVRAQELDPSDRIADDTGANFTLP